MVNTRSTNKDSTDAGNAPGAQAGQQQSRRLVATSSGGGQPEQQQQQRPHGSLLHLLNVQHIDPIPPRARLQPASAPPAASHAPWNDIRAPLVPPTPLSAISGTLSVPGSSLAPPAPPPSEWCWGGILTPNTFRAEFGGQDHSSSASRHGQEGSSAAQDQQDELLL
ncbi:hypothetical protein BT96DRAFT_991773 [Gymnopus androsaceus JB14]|uniref:Uncharacterized protein n=1 Tax=Gymnopus androsaceus JB14 TaxID=1447944 RepID=A0A6A4HRN7_9AGAR|nr:hypothetical protein BT96DRAFT_991773 [Gymnopus androsaceus JB14]